ncbi:MAG: phosphate signaling complex protein PhoU [Oscillospiraceae bacterium]|nr:phosphate signaling complex protein PhoU [Oscillospiraceae bacterium]
MRNKFEQQLTLLNNMLIEMGGLIETSIALAIQAMKEQNSEAADRAVEYDREIDQMERDIEELCLKLLLQQQPVARDLRLISAALKMITDMERIGDQAADIAEITPYLSGTPYFNKMGHFSKMAEATAKMVTDSIDAFVKKDFDLAISVIKSDDIVDELFHQIKTDLIELLRTDNAHGEYAIDMLMIAKYFERIGDHAVNVAEWVLFSIKGEHVRY